MTWDVEGVGSIETPFDIEALLQACPKLYEAWKTKPFYLTTTTGGRVIVRYMDEDAFRPSH